jgi:hypothetical protein
MCVLQWFTRPPSQIFWSPLHPTRTCVCCPYRSISIWSTCAATARFHHLLGRWRRLSSPLSLSLPPSLFSISSSFPHLASLLSFSLHQLRGRGNPLSEALSVVPFDEFEPSGVSWRWSAVGLGGSVEAMATSSRLATSVHSPTPSTGRTQARWGVASP